MFDRDVFLQEDNTSSKSNSVASQQSVQSSSEVSSSSFNCAPGTSAIDDEDRFVVTTFSRQNRRVRDIDCLFGNK